MTKNEDTADRRPNELHNDLKSGPEPEAPKKDSPFTKEELDSMLYEWDEGVYPIQEYHVTNQETLLPKAAAVANDRADPGSNSNEDVEDEMKVYLDFNTDDEAHVIMFYQPWCPHCVSEV